jgi:putative component of toxin-antitoxin plasmid stabilization module
MDNMEYEVIETEVFRLWRENLRDLQVKHRIQARIDRVISGNFGD